MDCKEFHPYPYQQFCIQHIIDHPAAGLFVDMGMGKTVMTLTAFNYLKFGDASSLRRRKLPRQHGAPKFQGGSICGICAAPRCWEQLHNAAPRWQWMPTSM